MANPVIQEKKKSRFRLTHVARFLKRPAPLSPGWKGASLALGATALCLYVVQGYNMIVV